MKPFFFNQTLASVRVFVCQFKIKKIIIILELRNPGWQSTSLSLGHMEAENTTPTSLPKNIFHLGAKAKDLLPRMFGFLVMLVLSTAGFSSLMPRFPCSSWE